MLEQPLVFTDCSSIQYFNCPIFLTHSVKPSWVPYTSLRSTCLAYGIPCCTIAHQVLPT